MATQSWTASTKGADDFELGIPRTSPLIYHCTAPVSGKAEGLVFLIPDFNDDVDGEDFAKLRAHLAQQYNLLAVSVEYHGYRSRLKDGAWFDLSEEEFSTLSGLCASHGVALLDRNALISALKQLPRPYEFEFRVVPANGEYQNFGVMQALDHLHVLHHLMHEAKCEFDIGNVIAMGVGHGGYLAHLIAKFAPSIVRAVFEADSRTSLPASFLFGGKGSDGAPYYYHLGNVRIFPIIYTRWRQEASAEAGFTKMRGEIRDAAVASHLGSAYLASRPPYSRHCCYRLMLSQICDSGIAELKKRQAALLHQGGFDVVLHEMEKLDGKPKEGGVLNELQKMFDDGYPELPALGDEPPVWQSSVSYLAGELLYCFDMDKAGCQAMAVPVEKRQNPIKYY